MSRYYKIEIGDGFATFDSHPGGKADPGALQVELDIIAAVYATPVGASMVRIWGVSIQQISQAQDFNGKAVKVYGGMKAGLPLASPKQAGLLAEGVIQQGFGNWVGTDMTLDLFMVASVGQPDDPANIVLNWPKGQPLAQPLRSALETAFPNQEVSIEIDDKLVQDRPEAAFYGTLSQLAIWLRDKTRDIIGGDYGGVQLTSTGSALKAYDGSSPSEPKQIEFNDLIGQPTWIDPATIQVNTVMRADVAVGDVIRLPRTQVTTTAASLSQYRNASVFQGAFRVVLNRSVGNSRAPDAAAWITTLNCVPVV